MSTRAAKACTDPDCPNAQPCEKHTPKAWAGSTRRKQLPPSWEKRRRYILERDPICTVCHDALSREVHHTGDPSDHRYESLAGICVGCHKKVTAKQAAAARRRGAGGLPRRL